ncbi:unnamed protein product [Meganyctiphanes norvegica]|uniref:Zonadhesin n=1 Tax=Meganyctiphanes norvegica TaxID=48144 RepID=A0AAV2R5A2_MEGNR
MRAVLVLLLAACLSPATAQLDFISNLIGGSYLPPDKVPQGGEQCTNQISTTTIQDVATTRIEQPVTIVQTSTTFVQAIVSATQLVTTTLEQIESRQVEIPVTQSFEQTDRVFVTRVVERPVVPEPELVSVIETDIVATTLVNENVVTSVTNVVRPEIVTSTQYETSVTTGYVTETRQTQVEETTVVTPSPVKQTSTVEFNVVKTQTVQLPTITSVVSSQEVERQQTTVYITPALEYYTRFVQETQVNTQVEEVTRTDLAYATEVETETEIVEVTDNRIDYVTATETINQNVVRTESVVIDRIVTDTQVTTEYSVSTRIVDQLDQLYVTNTNYDTITNYVTITGYPDTREEIVTRLRDEVQLVTEVIDNVIVNTVNEVLTLPCVTKTGYSYKEPKNPLTF